MGSGAHIGNCWLPCFKEAPWLFTRCLLHESSGGVAWMTSAGWC